MFFQLDGDDNDAVDQVDDDNNGDQMWRIALDEHLPLVADGADAAEDSTATPPPFVDAGDMLVRTQGNT